MTNRCAELALCGSGVLHASHPTLWWESFCRVAAESLINGIPVLASKRGGLAETLQEAGFLFDIPEQYTPQTRLVPTAEEVAPWIERIFRLWDDEQFYQQERRRCLAAAEAWRPERLLPRFEEFFGGVILINSTRPPVRICHYSVLIPSKAASGEVFEQP